MMSIILFYYFLRFYLFIRERHRKREAEIQAEGEAGPTPGARRGTWDLGLDPGTLGSRPGPKAALNRRATGAAP